jgi:hypothetical protein
MRRVAVALVHHPVLDRQSEVVTTAITNLDLHDIARSAHTYGVSDYFVAHPVAAQRELAERVRSHWVSGSGARRIPDRSQALELLRVVESLSNAVDALGGRDAVEIWTTSAGAARAMLEHGAARQCLAREGRAVLVVLGTGWGLAPEVHAAADQRLAPIRSPRGDGYNHLSVRAAAAILFDRLLGAHEAR